MRTFPICPSGGSYTVNSVGYDPECDTKLPGHTLSEVGLAITQWEIADSGDKSAAAEPDLVSRPVSEGDMLAALSHKNYEVRISAAIGLIPKGAKYPALGPVYREMLQDKKEWRVAQGAKFLATLPSQRDQSIPALLGLMDRPRPYAKGNALVSLAKLAPDDPEIRELISSYLESDDEYLQDHAVKAMKEMKTVKEADICSRLHSIHA